MNYYNLKFNPDELGTVPQDKDIVGDYYVDAPNALRYFASDHQIERLWVPEAIELNYHAKFTDILCLNFASRPYLVLSDKFITVITTLRLPEYQIFPLNIVKKGKEVPYNIFISKAYFADYIDFQQSSFYFFYKATGDKEPVEIRTVEEFWSFYNQMSNLKYLRASKIELHKHAIAHDIFRLPKSLATPFYVVSEVFVEAVKKAKLTGVHFVPFGEL